MRRKSVAFVTVAAEHPGSDNNFADGGKNGPAAQGQAEYAARNAANLEWLRAGFAAAKASHSKGVMIVVQADMWDPTATVTHFADTKVELARQSIAFVGKVVLVNGDSHSFESGKPLTDAATTNAAGLAGPNVIENFTRVTTFGDVQNHWVSATIDAKDAACVTASTLLAMENSISWSCCVSLSDILNKLTNLDRTAAQR